MKCSQCDKDAIYQYPNGLSLCLDCLYKMQSIANMALYNLERQLNALDREVEMITGIPEPVRYPERVMQQIQTGPVAVDNSLSVSNSQIGILNTGIIDNINSNIRLLNQGNNELAKSIYNFTSEVLKDTALSEEKKDEITKLVNQILEEKKSAKPNTNLLSSMIKLVSKAIGGISTLKTLWDIVSGLL